MVELASGYGRYGYRKVTALLQEEGWRVNHKRIERLWRQEGLKVPQKQPKRKRLWLADGSCVRLRPAYKDHVWSYDFVADRTSDGRIASAAVRLSEISANHLKFAVLRILFITSRMTGYELVAPSGSLRCRLGLSIVFRLSDDVRWLSGKFIGTFDPV